MTRARKAVLAVLEAAITPVSAGSIRTSIGPCCDQATVYRALGYLESSGQAESFVLRCDEHGTERYYVSKILPHRHWFHCEACHRFIDLGACKLSGLCAEIEEERGLLVKSHTLYFSGLCRDCREGATSAHEDEPRSKQA